MNLDLITKFVPLVTGIMYAVVGVAYFMRGILLGVLCGLPMPALILALWWWATNKTSVI